jgi:hypothetical protein
MFSYSRIPSYSVAFVLAFTAMTPGGSAFARTPFDGAWGVLIVTSGGACAPSYRYGVQIVDGAVAYEGGMVNMQGRVTPRGAVRVGLQSGGQWANGSGHMTKTRGNGVWKGQGTAGTCFGTWIAERH